MAKLIDPLATERPIPRDVGVTRIRDSVPNEGIGKGLQQAGAQMTAGLEDIYAAAKVEEERLDNLKVQDAINQAKAKSLDLEIGDTGFKRLKGADVVAKPILPEYRKRYEDAVQQIAGTLSNDRQREKFMVHQAPVGLQMQESLLRHMASESDAYAGHVFENAVKTSIQLVGQSPLDPMVAAAEMVRIDHLIDAEVERKGYRGKEAAAAADVVKKSVRDQLITARVDAMLYSDPITADKFFRANEKEISNPAVRLQLQAKTREAATAVSATIEAQKVVDDVRARPQAVGAAQQPQGSMFEVAVNSLLKREGGYNPSDGKSGAPVNFGINQRANPDIDVRNLTRERAMAIYRERYWDKIGGDNLAPATAIVALDTAALQGVDVAKRLIADTGGDPTAMLTMRRAQLADLAARDPGQAPYLRGWMKRLDGLQAEISKMPEGGMVRVGGAQAAEAPNTSGLPNSRDIAAQLPIMLLRVEKRANELYGSDPSNPDRAVFVKRMTSEIHSKIAADVQQLNAIQRQAQGVLIDAVTGTVPTGSQGLMPTGGGRAGTPGALITSFSQIQADPKLMAAWQTMDPAAKLGIERLMEHNLRATDKGDEVLYRTMWNRIHLPAGHPEKIDFYAQIVDPKVADRLSIQQIGNLRLEIDRNETPGGRSITQMRRAADAQVSQWFKTNVMFTAQPERQIAATMRWNEDVGRKVDAYVAAGQADKVRAMFQLDTPESVISPAYLQSYVNSTPAQGVASAAQAARAGAPTATPAAVTQPSSIDTREKLEAWFATLPANVTSFVGTDGKTYRVPGRTAPAASPDGATPAPAPAAVPAPSGKPAEPVMLPTGKIVEPSAEPAAPELVEPGRPQRKKLGGEDITWTDVGNAIVRGLTATAPVLLLGHGIGGALADIAEAIPSEPEKAAASFRALVKAKRYTPQSEELIQAAIDSGKLTKAERALADRMLEAISQRSANADIMRRYQEKP